MAYAIESDSRLERLDRSVAGKVDQGHKLVVFGLAWERFPLFEIEEPVLEKWLKLVVCNSLQSGNAGLNSRMDLRIGRWHGRRGDELRDDN